MSDEETVLPENTIEQISSKILYIEKQILSSSDPEEKKQLREEKKQLREEKNLKLRLQLKEGTSHKFYEGKNLSWSWKPCKSVVV